MLWLGLLLTERCNVNCGHCFIQGRRRSMSVRRSLEYIDEMAELSATSGEEFRVSLTGGEIFLNYPALLQVTARAKERGASRITCVTNGFWGNPRSAARQMARDLRKAGGTNIFFSIDDYHQEHIPFDTVMAALEAAGEAGFEIGIKCVVGRGTSRLSEIIAALGDLPLKYDFIGSESLRVPVSEITDSIKPEFLFRKGIPRGKCPSLPILNIWPDGTVFGCAGAGATRGLIIGNTRSDSISDLWQRVKGSPLLGALAEKGPSWFLPHFNRLGVKLPRIHFVNECDLCHVMLEVPDAEKVFEQALYDWRKERVARIIKAARAKC